MINEICKPLAKMIIKTAAVAIFAFPVTSWANVKFCNKTPVSTTIAIAYVQRDAEGTTTNGHSGVTVEGWWTLQPTECKVLSDINAGGHWVYYYAESKKGDWRGSSMLCVPTRAFTIGGRFRQSGEGCNPGHQLKGFKRMNAETTHYTMSLT